MQISGLPVSTAFGAADVLAIEINGVTYKITGATLAAALQSMGDYVTAQDIVNNLTTTEAGYVLDARQGKALLDAIEALGAADVGAVAANQGAANAGKALVIGNDGNVTTGKTVRPDAAQTLTAAEQARARGNIGAASATELAAEAAAREAADSDLKSALNKMASVADSSAFNWTLQQNINGNGDVVSAFGFALSKPVAVQDIPAFINLNASGYSGNATSLLINEFDANGVWLRRVSVASQAIYTMSSDCVTFRLGYGYAAATGVTITREMLDEFFKIGIFSEPAAKDQLVATENELKQAIANGEKVNLLEASTFTDGKYVYNYNGSTIINSADTACLYTVNVSEFTGFEIDITSYIRDNLRVILADSTGSVLEVSSGDAALSIHWTIPENAKALYVSALKAKKGLTTVRLVNKDKLILSTMNHGLDIDYSGYEYLFIKDQTLVCATSKVSTSGILARYCMADIGAIAKKVMCKFRTKGGVITLITTNQTRIGFIDNIVYQSVHVTFTRTRVNVSVFKSSNLTDVQVITYADALPTDGNAEYEVGFEFVGNGQLKVYLPDGTNQIVTDSRFDEYNGQYVIYEIYKDSLDSSAKPTIDFNRPTFTGFYAKPETGRPLRDNFMRCDGNLTVAPSGHAYRLARNATSGDTYYDEVNNIQG